jgi:predicted transcriptional regulator
MELVWAAGRPLTVREVLERLNAKRSPQLAYTTVMTVMNRLVAKEVLRRKREGRGYAYEATASDAAGLAVRNVMRDHGDAAMAHFVEAAKGDPRALRRLQRLLDVES